jgi:membrane-bound lytic murein transglycosylase B
MASGMVSGMGPGRRRVGLLLTLLAALAPGVVGAEGGIDRPAADFQMWLDGVRVEAATRGISAATLDLALTGLAPLPRVLELDRRQPEATVPFSRYVARAVSTERVRRGRALMAEHGAALAALAERSGVPESVVVALWGLESDYGRDRGAFPVIPALATLAHDGRRAALFRAELLDALQILDEGHITLDRLRGSWAGATGQSQFLPSSFLRHATDGDGDGRRDIWTSRADVFASIAAYLVAAGWDATVPWGQPVRGPAGAAPGGEPRPAAEWRALGFRAAGGQALPATAAARLVQPEGPGGPAYLVSENFEVLRHWNRSTAFAITVGTLADRLAGEPDPGPARPRPRAPGARGPRATPAR